MQIIPKGATPAPSNNAQAEARDRAIAKLSGGNDTPVADPNNISVEEIGAVNKAPSEPATSEAPATEGQTTKGEGADAPKASEATEPETKEDPLSTQYAVLARKEKALRAKVQSQEASIKAKEDALAAREAAIKAKEAEYADGYIRKDKLKADPYGTLLDADVSYDDVTQQALNSPQDPRVIAHIKKLEAELRSHKQEVAEMDKQRKAEQQESQTKQYQQAVAQLKRDAERLVKGNEAYEMIERTGSHDDVVQLIERTFKEDGHVMSVEDAAQEVEKYLEEEAYKLSQANKIQKRHKALAPAPTKTSEAESGSQAAKSEGTKQPQKTLTNQMSAGRPLSARERALLAFNGVKKQ